MAKLGRLEKLGHFTVQLLHLILTHEGSERHVSCLARHYFTYDLVLRGFAFRGAFYISRP